MRKLNICLCKNKAADQLCSNCTADQRLCFRYSDRTVPLFLVCILMFLGCPEGWLAGPDSCYFMPNKSTSQRKFAVNKCKNFGGHLVNIETEAENNFLSVLFSDFSGGRWEFLRFLKKLGESYVYSNLS